MFMKENMLAYVTLPISSVDRVTRNNIGTVKMEQLLAASTLNHWPQRIFYHPTCALIASLDDHLTILPKPTLFALDGKEVKNPFSKHSNK